MLSLWDDYQEEMSDALAKYGYWSQPHFLKAKESNSLLNWALMTEEKGLFTEAAVGKSERKQKLKSIRSDKIYWIDPSDSDEYLLVSQIYGGLMKTAKEQLFLPVKRFECHFAKYSINSFYSRHRDRHKHFPSRLLTCVVYLSDLQSEDGGQLVIHVDGDSSIEVSPQKGTLVVFDSQIEHEVKLAHAERYSLTGWVRDDIHPGLLLG